MCVELLCRQGALEMERLRETRRAEEEAWFRQQQLLLEAEEERRKTLSLEDTRLTNQRARSHSSFLSLSLFPPFLLWLKTPFNFG